MSAFHTDRKEIDRKLNRAMTVRQLLSELEQLNENAIVGFSSDYGDHCHTRQFLPVRTLRVTEWGSTDALENSAYSQSGLALVERSCEDEVEDDNEGLNLVVMES